MEYKQVIVIRKDLNLSLGKIAVQVAHASVSAYKKANKNTVKNWESQGAKKVVLQVNTEKELLDLFENTKKLKLPSALIKDAGLTEIPPGTITCLGIGPEKNEKIDKLTGELPLLD